MKRSTTRSVRGARSAPPGGRGASPGAAQARAKLTPDEAWALAMIVGRVLAGHAPPARRTKAKARPDVRALGVISRRALLLYAALRKLPARRRKALVARHLRRPSPAWSAPCGMGVHQLGPIAKRATVVLGARAEAAKVAKSIEKVRSLIVGRPDEARLRRVVGWMVKDGGRGLPATRRPLGGRSPRRSRQRQKARRS